MKFKTVWIINHYALTPEQGGLCRHYYFAKELIKRGYNVRIFTASTIHNTAINMIGECEKITYKDIEYDGVPYTYINVPNYQNNGIKRINNMLSFAFKIKKIWKAYKHEKPDVIYTSSPDIFTAWKAGMFGRRRKLPVVTEIRDLWPLSVVEYKGLSEMNPIVKILYSLEKSIYKKTNALIFTMPGGLQYIADKKWTKRVSPDKVFNINNGIDIALQEKQKQENVLDDEDLSEDKFKVIYAGSIRTVNSVDLIVKAAELLKCKEDIKFIIYGDGDKRAELEKYCLDNGLTNIKFKGRIDKKYIPYVCSMANVNIISVKQTKISNYGVSWNKLFDYMNAGKPILSTVKVNFDLIEKYQCGISLSNQTPQSIADAIMRLYEMPIDDYNLMCKNAKNAAKDFDYEILTDKLEEVIDYAIEHYKR